VATVIAQKPFLPGSGAPEAGPARPGGRLPPPAFRWLFVGAGLLIALVLVGVGALACINLMARQTVRTETTYPFTGSRVEVDAELGDVQIERGVPGEVAVTQRAAFGLRRPQGQAQVRGDTFVVTDQACPLQRLFRCDLRWTVVVPADVDVVVVAGRSDVRVAGVDGSVKVTSTGDIDLVAVTGEIALVSHDGDIRAEELRSQRVVATTDAGAVQVSFRAAPRLVLARTGRGEVEVEVPDGTGPYRVKAVADDGLKNVLVPIDINSDRTVNVESGAGNVIVTHHAR
jgi:hypothetical protein